MSARAKLSAAVITLLALVAGSVSLYLTWTSWQAGDVLGCTGDSHANCDAVLGSQWSVWLGMPVSLFGVLVYAGILLTTWPAAFGNRFARTALLTLALMAAGSAVWFIGLQAFWIQSFCWYCLTAHTCGLLVGILSLVMVTEKVPEHDYDQMRSLLGVASTTEANAQETATFAVQPLLATITAAVGLFVLMLGQVVVEPPEEGLVFDTAPLAENGEIADVYGSLEEPAPVGEDPLASNSAPPQAPATPEPIEEIEPGMAVAEDDRFAETENAEQAVSPVESGQEQPSFDDSDFFADYNNPSEPEASESTAAGDREGNLVDDSVAAESVPAPAAEQHVVARANDQGDVTSAGVDASGDSSESEEHLAQQDKNNTFQDSGTAATTVSTRQPRQRLVSVVGLSEGVDPYESPILGDPSAEHVFVEMLDYTCVHCRELHEKVHEALERYNGQLAFVIYHVPLSKKCNPHVARDNAVRRNACEYAKLAYRVWKLKPEAFAEYHAWLMEGEKPPRIREARERALKLAGSPVLLDKNLEAEVGRQLTRQAEMAFQLRGGLPMVLTPKGTFRSFPEDASEWFQFLETEFQIQPELASR